MKHIQLLKEGIKKVQHHIAESQGRQKRVDPSSKERKEQKNNPQRVQMQQKKIEITHSYYYQTQFAMN